MVVSKVARAVIALAAGLLAVGLTAPMAAAQEKRPPPTPEERAAALIRPAVVYIEAHWSGFVIDEDGVVYNDGKPYEYATRCTGFVVNPAGSIVTAGHCVDDTASSSGARRDFIRLAAQEAKARGTYENDPSLAKLFEFGLANWKVEGTAKDTPPDRQVFVQRGVAAANQKGGDTLPARVVDFRTFEQGDVALLKVDKNDLPSSLLAPSASIAIGTRVLAVGYPGSTDEVTDASLEPTNKDGSVNAKKTVGSVPFYEVSAAMSGGMSGGPTVDLQGRIIGINSFSPQGETEAFNFIAPSSLVAEILTKNGVKNELGRTDTIYRQGLEQYYSGKYTDSMKRFDQALALDPSHQQAQEFRQSAAAAKSEGLEGGSSLPVIPVVAVLVVLIGIAVAVFVVRGRRGTPAPAMAGAPSPAAVPTPMAPAIPATPVGVVPSSLPPPSPPPQETPADEPPHPLTTSPPEPPGDAGAAEPAAPPPPSAPAVVAGTAPPEPAAEAGERFCPTCGTPRAEGGRFCSNCGHRF